MGKKYLAAKKQIDPNLKYDLDRAVELAKKTSTAKFDAAVEVHIHLGIDTHRNEQHVKGTVVLPFGTGKEKKIAAFVPADQEKIAAESGADIVGSENLIQEIKTTGRCSFDVAVAHPAMMKNLATIAKILGQKGLMPSPKNETVSADVAKTIKALKGGKIIFKNDDGGNIHQIVGRISWEPEKLKKNISVFLDAVKKAKPSGLKGQFLQKITLCSTMGPGINVLFS